MPTILFIPRVPRTSSQDAPPRRLSLSVCSRCGASLDRAAERCPECGQPAERQLAARNGHGRHAFTEGLTESAGIWLIIGTLLVVVIGTPLYWLQNQYAQMPKPETEWQQKARFQAEAENEMLKECTNVIVGLTRIIRSSVMDAEDNPQLWTGSITAEFVNRFGGIERTNVPFRFSTDTGADGLMHIRSLYDSGAPPPMKKPGQPTGAAHRHW
jgi:ribosomal protein L40E